MVWPLFASLLGGALGARNERKAINAQNAYNHPSAIRARAEEAGFNPLLFIGPGVGQQTAVGGSNFMGSAIADAGMMLADKLAKRQDLRKLDAYKAQNQALQKQVNQMTLRPKVGGLYAQREAMPTRTAALGGGNAVPSARSGAVARDGVSGGNPNLSRYNWLDTAITSQSDDGSRVPKKPLFLGGHPLEPTSGTSDSEAIGSRYGEDFASPSWFAGWGAFVADLKNDRLKAVKSQFGQVGRAFQHDKMLWRRNSENLKGQFGADWYKHQFPN